MMPEIQQAIQNSKSISGPRSIDEVATLANLEPMLMRYTLHSDASVSRQFEYFFFRLRNAVKAIFLHSEWQCAKRNMTNLANNRIDRLAPMFLSLIQNDRSLISKTISATIEAGFYSFIDSKLDHNTANLIKAITTILRQKAADPFEYPLERNNSPQKLIEYLKVIGFNAFLTKTTPQLIDIIDQTKTEVLKAVRAQQFTEPCTADAIENAIDLQLRTIRCLSDKPLVQQLIAMVKTM